MTTTPPSVAVMGLSKKQYIELADRFRDKAQQAHDEARAARNEAVLLRAQLETLRKAYEPPNRNRPPLTDAAGNPEPTLETTAAEQE